MENSLELSVVEVQLDAVKKAQQRTRYSFVVATVASVALIVATYNAHISWYRGFAVGDKLVENTKDLSTLYTVQKSLLEGWVDSQMIAVPLLGVKVGIGDAALLGSFSLFIIAIWLYYTWRRENYAVAYLLRQTQEMSVQVRRLVYHGISSSLVFTSISKSDQPISDINEDIVESKPTFFIDPAFKVLMYLPAIAIALTMFLDVLSVFVLPAPFRVDHKPVWEDLGDFDKGKFFVMEVFSLAFFAMTWRLCGLIHNFEGATAGILKKYSAELAAGSDALG